MDITFDIRRLRQEYFSNISKILLSTSLFFFIASVIILILALVFGSTSKYGSATVHVQSTRPQPLRAAHGAVSSGNTVCNQIGVDVLKEGGNAIDAAVATAICLGARNCWASGIGGGGVAMVYTKDKAVFQYDGREVAPSGAFQTMLLQNGTLNPRGVAAIAVPGEIKLLHYLFLRHGSKKISWSRLFEPTINFTQAGFPVHVMLQRNLDAVSSLVLADAELRRTFAPNGTLLRIGDIVKMPKLSKTLSILAQNGSEAMYGGGPLTQAMLREINSQGGYFGDHDIQDYNLRLRTPVSTTFRNMTVFGAYPPISGGVSTIIALNILENFDLEALGWGDTSIHLVVEALKFAFAHRLGLGDPDFVDITEMVARMKDKTYAKALAQLISLNHTRDPEFYFGPSAHVRRFIPYDSGTTHISVVDADRNLVAITTTINSEFGSAYMGAETGIIYNNQMDDFSTPGVPNYYGLAPSAANFIEPKKRMISSMTPLIITKPDGSPIMTIGGTGGPRIFTNVLQSILNILVWNKNIKESSLMPRYHHQLYPNVIRQEVNPALPAEIASKLEARGHVLAKGQLGIVNGVHIKDDGVLEAASDWRKSAESAGY